MPNTFQFSWCPKNRIRELQKTIDTHYCKGHVLARDARLLQWQYRHPSEPDKLSMLIAECGGEIAGLMGMIPAPFNDHGRRCTGVILAFWLTDPRFRSSALGLRLLQRFNTGPYAFVGCLGFNDATRRSMESIRCTISDSIPRFVRGFHREALQDILDAKPDLYATEAREFWLNTCDATTNISPPQEVEVVGWNDQTAEAWDQAWSRRLAPRICGAWRDSAHLRWRYREHPRFAYQIRFARDNSNGNLIGLLVYRLAEIAGRHERVLRIVDCLGEAAGRQALAAEVCRVGNEQGVAFADFSCTQRSAAESLKEAGFVEESGRATQLPALFQPLDFRRTQLNTALRVQPEIANNSEDYFQTCDVYFTRSDGDQDRPN